MAVFTGVIYSIILNLIVFAFITATGGYFAKNTVVHFGIIGTVLIIISLGYIFRKKHLKTLTSMKTWLDIHVVTGTIGAFLILIHSEFYFRALIPSIALIALEVVIISGIIGRYMLSKMLKTISEEKRNLKGLGKENSATGEDDLYFLVMSASLMKNWKFFHVQVTVLFAVTTLLHVVSEFYYRGLRL
ncbi:MAG: hypothetical protein ACK4M9_04215 [Anaerobacillus sp.]|uniref:hypothetical protein n=1 Tax=Anaerobacillus sp. TaxID=1872506 RepID=UPI00391ADA5F